MTDTDLLKYKLALHEWADGTDAGASSRTIARVCGEINLRGYNLEPFDEFDFGRCVRLVAQFPELRRNFDRLRTVSNGWAWIVNNWDALESMYRSSPSLLGKTLYDHRTIRSRLERP